MIYLDYNASTPVDPAVLEAMWPYLGEYYGNPSSGHLKGAEVSQAVATARRQVAALLGCAPEEVVFTSGGTESNNMVIKGVAHTFRERGRHIVTSAIEHPAVINPCRFLERCGWEVSYVGVDSAGMVDPPAVAEALRPDTVLVSIMHANNEVGTIQPIPEIAEIAHKVDVLVHTDAAQSCGKIDTKVGELGVDFLSVAGHKLYAPQGIGALYIKSGIEIEPLHHGAGHERGRRAGTEPVPAIVGLGAAAQLAAELGTDQRMRKLRDRLYDGLKTRLGEDLVLLGHAERRLPNTLALGFRGRSGADILVECLDVCASTGAACHSGAQERSAVLTAMKVPDEVAFGAIRFSVGRFSTEAEIDEAVAQITAALSSE